MAVVAFDYWLIDRSRWDVVLLTADIAESVLLDKVDLQLTIRAWQASKERKETEQAAGYDTSDRFHLSD